MKLVIHPPIEEARLKQIREAVPTMEVVNATDEAAAAHAISDAEAFYGTMTPTLLSKAAALQWVQTPTASLEHYMFPELIEHSCRLSNMRGLFYDVIADHVMGYVIMFAHNLHLYVRQQMQAKWSAIGGEDARAGFSIGPGQLNDIDNSQLHLADCTMGVVGVGSIGGEIVRRATAFGINVIGIDPVRKQLPDYLPEIWPPDRLPDLLSRSDFVVIAAPHTPQTYKLFGAEQFRQMKQTAYLINIGRGAIVDLTALTAALQNGQIAGAGLDVFEIEPLPPDHPLWPMENVIITPHIAAASPRVHQRHTETLLENIRRFARGEDPLTLVDKRKWF